jgi:iron uptake system EfeUOB component EfeO/EfeM
MTNIPLDINELSTETIAYIEKQSKLLEDMEATFKNVRELLSKFQEERAYEYLVHKENEFQARLKEMRGLRGKGDGYM